jgi:hypothetical protein
MMVLAFEEPFRNIDSEFATQNNPWWIQDAKVDTPYVPSLRLGTILVHVTVRLALITGCRIT